MDEGIARCSGYLYAAYRDVTCVEALLGLDVSEFSEAIAFHSQQAAEKQLKSVYVDIGIIPPRTHDLLLLLDYLVDKSAFNIDKPTIEASSRLTRHAVASRYSFSREVGVADALEAVSDCNVIAKTIGDNGYEAILINSTHRYLRDEIISDAIEISERQSNFRSQHPLGFDTER